MNIIERIGNPSAAHLYLVEVSGGWIEVMAASRTQAGSLARRAGYVVHSMTMEG